MELDLHHPWSYVFINLGLGDNTTNFNITLTPELWNATGNGTLCIDKLELPDKVTDGTNGTLQVVTVGDSGNALYNCADIRFSKDAQELKNCTSEGVEVKKVNDQSANSTEGSSSSNSSDAADSGDEDSAASSISVSKTTMTFIFGLSAALIMGLGL